MVAGEKLVVFDAISLGVPAVLGLKYLQRSTMVQSVYASCVRALGVMAKD